MSQENENLEESQAEEVIEEEQAEVEVDPLEVALAEAADYKDKYLRAHADFENSKTFRER